MGDTSETNTKVLSRELFLGVVALKRLSEKSLFARQGPFSQVRSHIYNSGIIITTGISSIQVIHSFNDLSLHYC